MNITFFNKGNRFTFTDSWCKGDRTQMINYSVNYTSLFSVIDIALECKTNTITKTIQKKRFFKTIIEEVEETIIDYYISINYYLNSYDKETSNTKIHIKSDELEKAKEVVEYINNLIHQMKKHEAEVKKTKEEEQHSLVLKEKERLGICIYDFVVIDFETTGFKSPMDGEKYDEILSVSIIDQDGNVLLNSLCKPQRRKTWGKAQEIHGISPAMVKSQPTFEELFPMVKEILYKSKLVIAYNIEFELKFLWGFDLEFGKPGGTQLIRNVVWGPDPMLMYCAYKGNERWQKLSTVAKHFKYKFEAHDSLEDVKATLYCYKKMLEYVNANVDKEYIINYGYLYDDGRKGKWLDLNTYEITDEVEESWCR